ncbi:Salivary plasminogen activator gamma, partial [Nibea albiflora]
MKLLLIAALVAALSVDAAFSRKKSWSRKNLSPKSQGTSNGDCLSGDGSSYRGSVSKSARNRRCLNWNLFSYPQGASMELGNHNYCRNPNQSLKPWCRVRIGKRIVREFCHIPPCKASIGNWKSFKIFNKTNLKELSVYLGKTDIRKNNADKEQDFTVEK